MMLRGVDRVRTRDSSPPKASFCARRVRAGDFLCLIKMGQKMTAGGMAADMKVNAVGLRLFVVKCIGYKIDAEGSNSYSAKDRPFSKDKPIKPH